MFSVRGGRSPIGPERRLQALGAAPVVGRRNGQRTFVREAEAAERPLQRQVGRLQVGALILGGERIHRHDAGRVRGGGRERLERDGDVRRHLEHARRAPDVGRLRLVAEVVRHVDPAAEQAPASGLPAAEPDRLVRRAEIHAGELEVPAVAGVEDVQPDAGPRAVAQVAILGELARVRVVAHLLRAGGDRPAGDDRRSLLGACGGRQQGRREDDEECLVHGRLRYRVNFAPEG
jgi:hypothetical protein